jgi:mRNA interferase MazF
MDRETEDTISVATRLINRGEIYWVAADPTRGSVPGWPHPHVVVQEDVFNHSRISTVVVCALTTNISRAAWPGNILLEVGEGGLDKHSVVIASQVSSLYKSRLGDLIGRLSSSRVDQIIAGLGFVQSAFINRP